MPDMFLDSLEQISNTPQLTQMYKDTIAGLATSMTEDMGIISPSVRLQSAVVGGLTNPSDVISSTQYSLTSNTFSTDNVGNNIGNINDISGIFNHIVDNIDNRSYFEKKQSSHEDATGNMIEKAFVMYYENINNLKSIRDDISYNINTANKFLHRLHNYTNTNPNLHLLSKTKDKLQNKINSYEKHMNIDSKMNKEFEKNIENNKRYNYYLIIIYYVILILFFIFSNFMKNKYYKNPIANIMIILYIIAPFTIKYIILYLYKFYLYIMKKFNLLNTGLTYEDIIKYDSYNYENNQDNISYI